MQSSNYAGSMQELLGEDNGEHEPGHEESLQEDFKEEDEIAEGSHDHSNRDEL